jgi:hypothetical protein
MRSAKRLLLVAIGVLTMLMVLSGPAFGHTLVNKKGKERGHGCGLGIKGQTSPTHRVHKHVHVGAHHGDVHEAREKHFHEHLCVPEAVESPLPEPSPSETVLVAAHSGQHGGGSTATLLLAGVLLSTLLSITGIIRRRPALTR